MQRQLSRLRLEGFRGDGSRAGWQEMTIYELLIKNLEDIQEMLEDHGSLLNCLKEGGDTLVLRQCVSACPYKHRLKETLLETIQVLEESRKAFKSKQLETLRKKLIKVLAETA
jgi:hypothetical protein